MFMIDYKYILKNLLFIRKDLTSNYFIQYFFREK